MVIKNRRNKKEMKWTEEIVRNRKKDATQTLLIFVCSLAHSFLFIHSFIESFNSTSSYVSFFTSFSCVVFGLNIKGWHKHLNTIIWMRNKNWCIRASGNSTVYTADNICTNYTHTHSMLRFRLLNTIIVINSLIAPAIYNILWVLCAFWVFGVGKNHVYWEFVRFDFDLMVARN